MRTHFSDDRIWLPYVVSHYIKMSGDTDILDASVSFLEGATLEAEQDEAYFEPIQSSRQASLFERCARALDMSLTTGLHGLPPMGSGDWNDGMNRVGNQGKGESVWLVWFLLATLPEFANTAEMRGDNERAIRWHGHITQLKAAAEAWDGAWYRRAYFDDGTPLGSAANAECRIDSIAQSWAVISGGTETERDPGYIKSYPPGVRENGGQCTHAAVWSVIAYAILGEGDQAGNCRAC